MNYIFAEGLSKRYAEKLLFENINISINKGQRIALIARNGTGKTTLLRCIAGLDTPDDGRLEIHPNITIGYLEQMTDLPLNATVLEAIFQTDNPVLQLIKKYEECLILQQIKPSDEAVEQLQNLMQQMDQLGAWDYEVKMKEILSKLKIINLQQPVSQLSGGQKKRIALAAILVQQPDLMILDEPTNHLDIEMIEWLEQYLSKTKSAILCVSHDRYFIDGITNEIIEIEQGHTYKYKGNYAYYLEKKAERQHNMKANLDNAQRLYKRELEWMRRQPKARTTKAKSRVDNFDEVKKNANKKVGEEEVKLSIKTERIGSKILELHYVNKAYGDLKLMEDFFYKFKRFERVGIVGENGTGKTTFLKMILGLEKPDSGKIVVGDTVKIGYYRQEDIALNDGKRIIETVRDVAEFIQLEKGHKLTAVGLLERFLFPRTRHFDYVGVLSGGEKRRLHLLTILMKNPNFLILDEPTNDLDLMTLNVLEDFLADFPGCLIIVTHDRYFMDKLVDHLFIFEGEGKIRDFPGNYTQYRLAVAKEKKAEAEAAALEKANAPVVETKAKDWKRKEEKKRKLSYNEKREFESLETEIEKLEEQKADLENKLGGGGDAQQIMDWSNEISVVLVDLETKTDRWLELSEFA
ncbi:UNVERIFIED_CONTAM: hypothetical protein GTU68_049485 [Idotea baltica]|nr:hypothetical protein [Idotea baltica]